MNRNEFSFNYSNLSAPQKKTLVGIEKALEAFWNHREKKDTSGNSGTSDCEDLDKENHVLAITGPRGWGKSTLLKRFREPLKKPADFFPTQIIDASMVDETTGLMATCIQGLWDIYLKSASKCSRSCNTPSQDLKDRYKKCFSSALSLGESYRDMAREMAMSPGQYEKIIHDRVSQHNNISKDFKNFVEAFGKFVANDPCKKPLFVIFLDDLDLAQSDLVLNWARAMEADYRSACVLWVLSFARDRLIPILSNPVPGKKRKKDLYTGIGLLSKLVASHRQYPLAFWSLEERCDFYPFNNDGEINLKELMNRAGVSQMLPLLPNNPRALEGIYKWLEENLTEKDDQFQRPNHQEVLLKLAEVNNLTALALLFGSVPPIQWITTLSWENKTLNESDWRSMIDAAKTNQPIWGLPTPKKIGPYVGDLSAEAFTEALCDTGLQGGTISPYQFLMRLPFTKDILDKSSSTYPFPETDIIEFFEDYPQSKIYHLFWGSWSNDPEKGMWDFKVDPQSLWRTLLGFRKPFPIKLKQTLFLYDQDIDREMTKNIQEIRAALFVEKRKNLLPGSFRSLLLLVDVLKKAPWKELEAKRTLWTPITLAQCAAAFQLSSLANAVWSDDLIVKTLKRPYKGGTKDRLLFYFPKEPFSAVYRQPESEIDAAYDRLIKGLKKLKFVSLKKENEEKPLLIETRKEIFQMLQKLLKLPVVTELRLKKA